jgi:hypothetical protein
MKYEKSVTGWAAYVPDLPGVIATGSTTEKRCDSLFERRLNSIVRGSGKTRCHFLSQRRQPKWSPSPKSIWMNLPKVV